MGTKLTPRIKLGLEDLFLKVGVIETAIRRRERRLMKKDGGGIRIIRILNPGNS